MKFIKKYVLERRPSCSIEMREGAQIMSIVEVSNTLCLFALVDTAALTEVRHFKILETGDSLPEGHHAFVATVVDADHYDAYHVFEKLKH